MYQPQSQSVLLFQKASFGVIADGVPPIYYQWIKDGTPIAGATNDQLVLPHVLHSNAGHYTVEIKSAQGTSTSTGAVLSVITPQSGDLDGSFRLSSSISDFLLAVAIQADDKIIVGGAFGVIQGTARGRIARLNANGTIDPTFMHGLSGANGWVNSVALQRDGKVLVGGYFTAINGKSCNRIARLNVDGTLDTSFQAGLSGANNTVRSIVVQSDSKILIGGDFSQVNGVNAYSIARLNPDGTLDPTFANPLNLGQPGVTSIAVQSDGKVLIGGYFALNGWGAMGQFLRLNTDGTLDQAFADKCSVLGGPVFSICLQRDQKILVGGFFTNVNGISRNNIARLEADGSLDRSFQEGMPGTDFTIRTLAVQESGKVLLGGFFSLVNGISRPSIACLNPDGTLAAGFYEPLAPSNGGASALAIQSDGKVLFGGYFVEGIKRWTQTGLLDSSFQNQLAGVDGAVQAIFLTKENQILIGGVFGLVDGSSRRTIARLHPDGTLDQQFYKGFVGGDGGVYSIAVQPDAKVVIGGYWRYFDTGTGESESRIVRLNADGTQDHSFLAGRSGADGAVRSVLLQKDGKILIAGEFTRVHGVSRERVARLNADGSLDNDFQNGLSGADRTVYSLSLQTDNKILVSGAFSTVNGIARNRLARLNVDGSLDPTFQNGMSGADGTVCTISVQDDGKILIGGYFTTVNGLGRNRIARLEHDGTLDESFQNGLSGANDFINSITLQPDGKMLVCGAYTRMNGANRSRISRLHKDGSLDVSFQKELSGADNTVWSIALQGTGTALIGGGFWSFNGVPASFLGRIWLSQPSYIESLRRSDKNVILALRVPPGSTNRVEFKTNLNLSAWMTLPGDVVADTSIGPTLKVDDTPGNSQHRIYRVWQLP